MAWDLHGQGVDFWEWMRDLLSDEPSRSPGYLLSLIEWLPAGGALSACLQAEGARDPGRKARPLEGAHAFYGHGPLWHILADIWDLQIAGWVAGGKKKAPSYPRPGVKAKAAGVPLRALIPKRHPVSPPPVSESEPARHPGPRVAGRRKGR